MFKKFTGKAIIALAVAGALTLSACGDEAGGEGGKVKLNMATMVQPNVPSAPAANWFFDELEKRSNGRIEIDRTEPESICKAAEIATCVKDGRADIGVSISDYTPQLFPQMTVVSIPFMADNSQALMESIYKVNKENPAAKAMWEKSGLELIGAWGPGKLIIGTNKRVQDIKDVNGMRFRVTGAYLQQAFSEAGANVVALPAAETYEGIERGLAEAVAWTMDGPVDYKLMEQLSTWSDPGVGHYTTFAMWMNKEKYDSLPADLKKIVDEVREEFNGGAAMKAFNTKTESQCDTLLAFPKTDAFSAWSAEATKEWKDKVQAGLIDKWLDQAAKDGLTDAKSYLDDYQKALTEASAKTDLVPDPVVACIDKAAKK